MKLYIDTDTNRFINDPNFKSSLESVSFKRGDSATVELIFVSSNTPLSATVGKDIKFGIKESGKYDGDYVVYTDEYTTSGNSYILNPSFNTVALNTLLNHDDSDDENDVASVSLMLETTWTDDAVNWYSTNTITAIVENDVNKGGESSPLPNQSLNDWIGQNIYSYVKPITAAEYANTFMADENGNTVLLRSKTIGTAGNAYSLSAYSNRNTYASISAIPTVSLSGNRVNVKYNPKYRFNIDGPLSANYIPVVTPVTMQMDTSLYFGYPRWTGYGDYSEWSLYNNGINWVLIENSSGEQWSSENTENITTSYPDEYFDTDDWFGTEWTGTTQGTPSFEPFPTSLSAISTLINSTSSLPITAFPTIIDVDGLWYDDLFTLTGGINYAVAQTPPYIHIYDNKVWFPNSTDTTTDWLSSSIN